MRLRRLAREDARLEKLIAEQGLEIAVMKEVNRGSDGRRARSHCAGTRALKDAAVLPHTHEFSSRYPRVG